MEPHRTATITITRTSVTSLTAFPQTVTVTSCLMSVSLSVVLSLTVTRMESLTLAISLLESVPTVKETVFLTSATSQQVHWIATEMAYLTSVKPMLIQHCPRLRA